MAIQTRRINYFAATVTDQPGEAYKLLSQLERLAGSLHRGARGADALAAHHLPEYALSLANEVKKAGLLLYGPQPALPVPGDDELGALARIHARLYDGNVNIHASSGVADRRGSFGYVIYVRPEDYERAASALGV